MRSEGDCRGSLRTVVAGLLPLVLACAEPQSEAIAIVDVTVVGAADFRSLSDQTVVVDSGRIVRVGPSATTPVPRHARIIDGGGRFLIPGLWDMHVHPDDPELWELEPPPDQRDLFMPLFVAWGVTTVRDMGGSRAVIDDWRARIAANELLGPRIFAPGPLLDGPEPMWPGSIAVTDSASGAASVDSLADAGADFIKVYSLLDRSSYMAIAGRARARGIPFAGHVPDRVSLRDAAVAGQASQEHLIGMLQQLADVPAAIAAMDEVGPPGTPGRQLAAVRTLIATYDSTRAAELFATFVESGTYVTPTLLVTQRNAFFDELNPAVGEQISLMPGYIRWWWQPANNVHLKDRPPEAVEVRQLIFRHYLTLVRDLHAAGVPLLAGTDTGGNPLLVAGRGLHEELELLVRAGLLPVDALRAATLNAAEFIGSEDSLGTVETGKIADLVLLDADPRDDISNTRRITAVIIGGRALERAELDAVLANVRRLADREWTPPDNPSTAIETR